MSATFEHLVHFRFNLHQVRGETLETCFPFTTIDSIVKEV